MKKIYIRPAVKSHAVMVEQMIAESIGVNGTAENNSYGDVKHRYDDDEIAIAEDLQQDAWTDGLW